MVSVVIQAGGESRRMGQDKALLPFLGVPLIARICRRLAPLAGEMIVITNHPDDYRFLGVRLAADLLPGRGPLGGLYTALSLASESEVAVAGCDMPFVSAGMLAFQHELVLRESVDAVLPTSEHGFEPFHAVYSREACLPAVQAALDNNVWRVSTWLNSLRLRVLTPGEMIRYDPPQLACRNVNTPAEFIEAERIAREAGDL